MRAKIRYTEDIKNLIVAVGIIKHIVVVADVDTERSTGYLLGWSGGFQKGLDKVQSTIDEHLSRQKVWLRRDLKGMLQQILAEFEETITFFQFEFDDPDYKQGFSRGVEASLWIVGLAFGVTLYSPKQNTISVIYRPWLPLEDIHHTVTALGKMVDMMTQFPQKQIEFEQFMDGFTVGLHYISSLFSTNLLRRANASLGKKAAPSIWTTEQIKQRLHMNAIKNQKDVANFSEENCSQAFQVGFMAAIETFSIAIGIENNIIL